jgi:hypothetical protein
MWIESHSALLATMNRTYIVVIIKPGQQHILFCGADITYFFSIHALQAVIAWHHLFC